jgi:F0F1-type ATP synthase alpha subunit
MHLHIKLPMAKITLNVKDEFGGSSLAQGRVSSCKDGIIEIEGLRTAVAGEIITLIDKDIRGIVINPEQVPVKALVLKVKDAARIVPGDLVCKLGCLYYGPALETAAVRLLIKCAGYG